MQQRNVLSRFRILIAASLGATGLALAQPALADELAAPLVPPPLVAPLTDPAATPSAAQPLDRFPLLSLFMPSPSLPDTPAPAASAPDDALVVHELQAIPQLPGTIDLTARPENLWDHLRNGFAMADLNDSLVLHYQQWYQNRPEALRRMVERSRPYLYHIVNELEARGMPTELALLPMVESSFNPMAYSRAQASGLWQFIPATGKRFNLEQSWWQDQRRDILASTSAALDYLQAIYDMHGDWHLALASYNWGEGAVKRAIEKNEARGLPTDYPSLRMPNETRHYVPKLQALKNIFSDPALALRLGIPDIPNEPYFATLQAPEPIDIKTAARLANMTVEDFLRLNPAHNRPVIKPETALIVPADRVDRFRNRIENPDRPLTNWRAYTVTSAEKLDRIANRFGISLGELQQVNGINGNLRLGAGSSLLVPGAAPGDSLGPLLEANAPRLFIEPEPRARGKAGKQGHGRHETKVAGKAEPRKAESSKLAASTRAPAGKVPAAKVAQTAKPAPATKSAAKSAPTRQAHAPAPRSTSSHAQAAKPAAPSKVARSGNGRRS